MILPYANTQMMSLFLSQVSKDFKGHNLIVQVDQASQHKSKKLKNPDHIALMAQPAYCAELTPVEHIREAVREKFLKNVLFETKFSTFYRNTHPFWSVTYVFCFRICLE